MRETVRSATYTCAFLLFVRLYVLDHELLAVVRVVILLIIARTAIICSSFLAGRLFCSIPIYLWIRRDIIKVGIVW